MPNTVSMSEQAETYLRWEPLPGLPEYPVGEVRFSYDGDILTITCAYSSGSDKLLTLTFRPRAFKAYDEFSDPWMEDQGPLPMVNHPDVAWTYPLQEVVSSRWLDRVVERTGGINDLDWRHFVIASGDMCLHVMAIEPERVELI